METARNEKAHWRGSGEISAVLAAGASILAELNHHLAAETDPQRAAQILADGARRVFHSRLALVDHFAPGPEGTPRARAVSHHESVPQPCRAEEVPQVKGLLGTLREGQPHTVLRLREVAGHPASVGLPPGHPRLRGLLAGTVADDAGEITALFMVSDRLDGADYDELDEWLAHSFATFCTLVLSRLCRVGRAEAERRELHDRLLEAKSRLEAEHHELEDFAYVVSHDLKEPLRGARALSQFLLEDYGDTLEGEAREYVLGIRDACDRLRQLIDDVLTVSRLDRHSGEIEPVDMAEVMEEAVSDLGQAIEEAGATVQMVTPLPVVACDRVHARTVLANLIGNAIKFRGEEPPLVEVGCSERDGSSEFYVRDNGIGIAPEHHERIFSLFQRLHARDDYEGTGAGLAIVKKIVGRYGGRIWVESEPGRGSTFRFTIPHSQAAEADREEREPVGVTVAL
ncbi:MAG: ATP-binding protein [Armatimonadota bacterium]